MKIKSLTAYSAASALLLGLSTEAQAQMIITYVDPDLIVGDLLPIDLNGDGIDELKFDGHSWWTFTSYLLYSSAQIDILNYVEIAAGAGVMQLSVGDVVDEGLGFSSDDFFEFFYGYYDHGAVSIDIGADWLNNDSYIGLRFDVSGETHYGWIRVMLFQLAYDEMPELYIKEYAYNATPDAPAPITLSAASTAKFPMLSDVGETNTPSDLQLHFQKADDESTVSAYRVILFNGFPPTLAEANAVPAENYTEIIPTGADVTINFSADTRDINGVLLAPGSYYRAIILSVADGVIVTNNDISTASPSGTFVIMEAPLPIDVDLTTTNVDDDISGFSGYIYIDDLHLSTIRAYISDEYAFLDELLLLGPEYYVEFMPVSGSNDIAFTPDKLITDAASPILFRTYRMNVVSMPDGVNNSIPAYTYAETIFKYPEIDITPTVSIVEHTGTAADIQLHFPQFINEDDLALYRIFVAKADADISTEDAYLFAGSKIIELPPAGIDVEVNLADILYDTDGNSIKFDEPYRVYVALKGDFFPAYYALSNASDEFVLEQIVEIPITDQANSGEPVITNEGCNIHLSNTSPGEHLVSLLNIAGQELTKTTFSGTEFTWKLPELPAGMYVISLDTDKNAVHQTIYLSDGR